MGELARTTSVERVFLGTSGKVVKQLGRANPRLAVTNGEVCFMGGEPAQTKCENCK